MYDYEHYFYEEELKGKSEAEIVKALKDPNDIAKQVKRIARLNMLNINQHFIIRYELLRLH